jgi:phosphoglycerol transferase
VKPFSHWPLNRRGSSDKVSAAPPSWRKLPSTWWRLRSDFGWALGAVILTSLSMVSIMRLWRANLWMPFTLGGDAPYYLTVIKGVLVHGWWLENPDLGAPFGQQLYDFPFLAHDGFHLVLIKLLGLFSSDPVFVANLFFFLSFPLVALTSFLVLRQLGISATAAMVCSVIYALAPYHFLRDHQHLNLAAYYSIPLGAYLVLSILSGKRLFARRTSAGPRVLAWASSRSLITLALCLLVASASSTYYAVFAILLLIAAMMLVFVTRRDVRALFEGGAVLGLIFSFLALALLPHLIYWYVNGPNLAVAHRLPYESENYGLVLTKMLLPVPGHQIEALSAFAERYLQATPLITEFAPYQSLGFIAAFGFVWLLLVALAGCLSPRWGIGDFRQRQLHRRLAAVTVIAFLIGTTGGFSSLFAWLVSPQIRAWERISIFISFFALAAVALLLDALQERVGLRGGRPVLAEALLLSVLMIGLFDLSNERFAPNYETAQNEYTSDARFVEAIDSELPPQAQVFQLPYIPFPEYYQPGLEMGIYEPLRPYLHSNDLRWSYGAVQGRPSADWQVDVADKPTEVLLDTVSDKGFDGIYIDRFGYPDRAAKLESELGELLDVEPLVSPDGRKSFFSLLSYKEKRALDGEKSGQWSGQWAAVSYPQEEADGEHPTDRKESNS